VHRKCVFPSFLDPAPLPPDGDGDGDDEEAWCGKNVCPNRNRSYVPAKIECAFAATPPLGELIFFEKSQNEKVSKMNNNGELEDSKLKKEYEAYKTLQDWVKTVPKTIKELEENGDTDKLTKYKKQVKLVLQKLEDIKFALENEN